MNGVNSNHVNHPLSHGRSSSIVNIPCFHLFGHVPNLLMCYALDLDPKMCYAPYSNLNPKICYAPYSNSDPKMYYAPNIDLEICHAPNPYFKMCHAPNPDLEMCHASDPECVMHQIQI
jgi:hypothetical protein